MAPVADGNQRWTFSLTWHGRALPFGVTRRWLPGCAGGAVQPLQQVVGGQFNVLVPSLGGPVPAGDDPHPVRGTTVMDWEYLLLTARRQP